MRRLEGGHGGDKNNVNNEANSSLIFVASRVTRDTLALFPPYPLQTANSGAGVNLSTLPSLFHKFVRSIREVS